MRSAREEGKTLVLLKSTRKSLEEKRLFWVAGRGEKGMAEAADGEGIGANYSSHELRK
jgi:hypothetical protein